MRNGRKFCSLALISVAMVSFLIIVTSTVSASITETRITNRGTASNPDMCGKTIVWQDNRNGNWDIYIQDFSTKKQFHTTNKLDQTHPAINGKIVVWADSRNGGSDIYMYDLSTQKEIRVTYSGHAYFPSIYGNIIVWNDNRNYEDIGIDPVYDVYMYDISTKKEMEIAKLNVSRAIYNNKIVMLKSAGDGPIDLNNIYVFDLSTRKDTQITSSGYDGSPDIYGNKIVWAHWTDNEEYSNIYMYDLSTKKETQITKSKSEKLAPEIYGNTLIWQDNRNSNWDIYAYDLVTHQQIHNTNKFDQETPAIYGNKIVWTDSRNGKPDIYMGTISYLPVAAFTASPTTGKAPFTVKFTDKSKDAYYWSWDFGDKTTSKAQNPVHKYKKVGKYTVILTVKNAAGSNTAKKTKYIDVK